MAPDSLGVRCANSAMDNDLWKWRTLTRLLPPAWMSTLLLPTGEMCGKSPPTPPDPSSPLSTLPLPCPLASHVVRPTGGASRRLQGPSRLLIPLLLDCGSSASLLLHGGHSSHQGTPRTYSSLEIPGAASSCLSRPGLVTAPPPARAWCFSIPADFLILPPLCKWSVHETLLNHPFECTSVFYWDSN